MTCFGIHPQASLLHSLSASAALHLNISLGRSIGGVSLVKQDISGKVKMMKSVSHSEWKQLLNWFE